MPPVLGDCHGLGKGGSAKVDVHAAIGDGTAFGLAFWGVIMRSWTAAIGFAVAMGALWTAPEVRAQAKPPGTRLSQTAPPVASELSAQARRPPRVRIYREDERGVYPSYYPGANAVRDCNATYVREYRPSGTVIVPRLNCFWRRG
jgi:hypothetical protein